jgi:hypothetical protein
MQKKRFTHPVAIEADKRYSDAPIFSFMIQNKIKEELVTVSQSLLRIFKV